MKLTLKGFFSILLLISAAGSAMNLNADCGTSSDSTCNNNGDCGCTQLCIECCPVLKENGNVYGKTYFAGRSQADNEARKMMGVEDKIHLFGRDSFYGVASIAVEYQQIFNKQAANCNNNGNNHDIGAWFSANGANVLPYSAAGYAGLCEPTNSNQPDGAINALQFGVASSSGTITFCPKKSDIIVDLDLFLGLDEVFCGLWARLYMPIVHTRWELNVIDKNDGNCADFYPADLFGAGEDGGLCPVAFCTMKEALLGDAFCDVPALLFGKVGGRRQDTGVAALRFDLGYDWFRRERWHFATSFDFEAPTGTKPCAEFLFEPVIGESRRWEIGGSINAAYRVWDNCDATQNLTLYLDATINTEIAAKQQRLLGLLVDGHTSVWSQYLLLKKFNAAGEAIGLERAANILAGDVKVAASVMGDVGLMLQYTRNCLFAGLGYEFWGRSEERLTARCFDILPNTYGVKGSTSWSGTVETDLDTCQNATACSTTIFADAAPDTTATGAFTRVYIDNDDIDYCPALHPGAFSNKVFGFVGANWEACDWQPYVLVGAEVEFGQENRAFSQWGIIGKGGISF